MNKITEFPPPDARLIGKVRHTKLEPSRPEEARRTNGNGEDHPPPWTTNQKLVSLGEWDAGDDLGPIPPRGWLLGNAFCRRFVSSLIADGGVGKTATRLAQYLSAATKRELTGEHVFMRCRVLIVSLEDDTDELRRRLEAAMLHFGIKREDVKGWLFMVAPGAAGGKLMTIDQYGRPVIGELAAKLTQTIIDRRIDIVALDPFVKSHSVEENHNSLIDAVVQVLTGLAVKHNIAVDVPHHTSKGPADPGNADKGRGASSMKDAARLVYTLSPMSLDEAKGFGLTETDRRSLVRMDSAKVNIAPPMTEAKWFRLVGVNLGNATDLYPNGDNVQTIEPWSPPETFAGLSNSTLNQILNEIDAGLTDGNHYTDAPNAPERAAWKVIERHRPGKAPEICRKIIKLWVASGLLTKRNYENPVTRKAVSGFKVDNEKRPT
jgi:AAA domain